MSATNMLMTFYLNIPASNSHTCSDEIHNVTKWAQHNNLKLNTSKSLEIIITNSTKKQTSPSLPPLLPSITRVNSMVVLGVTLFNNLKMERHISEKIKNGEKSLFALKTLKAHGMHTWIARDFQSHRSRKSTFAQAFSRLVGVYFCQRP